MEVFYEKIISRRKPNEQSLFFTMASDEMAGTRRGVPIYIIGGNTMRKIINGLLCGALALSLAIPMGIMPISSVNTYAAVTTNKYVPEGKLGDNVEYTYDKEMATLTVSGTGEMWDKMQFPKEVLDATSLVIEKGVTSIGEFAFWQLEGLKNVQIADTVTTIKEGAFSYFKGTVEIPASVKVVEESAFSRAEKIIVRGDLKEYENGSLGWNAKEIVLYGSPENLGKAIYECDINKIIVTIADENKQCTIKNGCITSVDGKEIYYYVGTSKKVTIPDTVEKIGYGAFNGAKVKEITFGKNIKEIGAYAFHCTKIKKLSSQNL